MKFNVNGEIWEIYETEPTVYEVYRQGARYRSGLDITGAYRVILEESRC